MGIESDLFYQEATKSRKYSRDTANRSLQRNQELSNQDCTHTRSWYYKAGWLVPLLKAFSIPWVRRNACKRVYSESERTSADYPSCNAPGICTAVNISPHYSSICNVTPHVLSGVRQTDRQTRQTGRQDKQIVRRIDRRTGLTDDRQQLKIFLLENLGDDGQRSRRTHRQTIRWRYFI